VRSARQLAKGAAGVHLKCPKCGKTVRTLSVRAPWPLPVLDDDFGWFVAFDQMWRDGVQPVQRSESDTIRFIQGETDHLLAFTCDQPGCTWRALFQKHDVDVLVALFAWEALMEHEGKTPPTWKSVSLALLDEASVPAL